MTAFHDAVMALEPGVFVPLDAPGDTATTAQDLMGAGTMVGGGAAVKGAAAGEVAFANEIVCTGNYWAADATLETRIIQLLNGVEEFTAAVWWRTDIAQSDATARVMLALTEDGFRLYRQSGSIIGTFYNASAVANNVSGLSQRNSEVGGGWQCSGLQLDAVEDKEFLCRNDGRSRASSVADGSTLRTTGANVFWLGATSGGASPWTGSLGPFALWDRSLTPAEWAAFFQAGLGATIDDSTTYPTLRRPASQRMQAGKVLLRS